MGSITYDGLVVHIDDRTLAHLQIVIVNKLRRGENFLMSWKDSPDVGDGRSAIWVHPMVCLHFKFEGSKVPTINTEWLATLAESADSSRGLIVTSEHGQLPKLPNGQQRVPQDTLVMPTEESRAATAVHA
ncbi:MAG: ATP-dependent ligase [Glaciihabitans sp.]|jgi:hypothetical protein|nr:ATP-dependent ligase [Glaciihabitans sp.]